MPEQITYAHILVSMGFPINKMFDNYSIAYFTERLAYKAFECNHIIEPTMLN